jgi:3-mercaptopyruvate sulfurtransferase SseA
MRLSRNFLIALSLIGALTLLACNSAEQNASQTPTPRVSPQPSTKTVNADGVRRITVTELQQLLAKNEAFVVDVRTDYSFNEGHIRGAILIPHDEIQKRVADLPHNKLIVTYCS